MALRLTRNAADAEDALQDTFLNAYRALGRFGGRARVSTWLYRIAANASYDVISRRHGRDQALDDGAYEPAAPGDSFAQSSQRQALKRALATLPDEFREAVVLCDIAGLGAGEAAELLGVPDGTVKSRVFRARALLAVALREPDALDPVEPFE